MELSNKNSIKWNPSIFIETTLLHTLRDRNQATSSMLIQFCKEILHAPSSVIRNKQPKNLMLKCLCFDNQCACLILIKSSHSGFNAVQG